MTPKIMKMAPSSGLLVFWANKSVREKREAPRGWPSTFVLFFPRPDGADDLEDGSFQRTPGVLDE